MLNFRLKVFRSVAEHLSFRKASEELYLSQPAVSLQIKTLEEEVGLQLFDRSGRQVHLTPAGETLLRDGGSDQEPRADPLAVVHRPALPRGIGE